MSWRDAAPICVNPTPSSRAVNLALEIDKVRAACAKHSLFISAIETLASGGTCVVLMNGTDAETLRRTFAKHVMAGPVQRTPLRMLAF